jgi:hypothetical protein
VPGLVAALLLGGAWLGWRDLSGPAALHPDALAAIAEDHVSSQRSAALISSDSTVVAGWLGERLPFGVNVPLFPGARLGGARLLVFNGRSGAVVEYVIAGRPLSYYILPILPGSGAEQGAAARQVRLTSRAVYGVAAWEDAGLAHALVGGVPGPRLVELAHYCIEQMSRAMDV